uniref:MerR family transcriptional regulator n=1 Tax=Lentilactobacillus hilgardii TaxID=1588 RepID=UPI00403F806B
MVTRIAAKSFYTVSQISKKLDVNPNTLRTYSLLIEKETGNDAYFDRSKSGARLYTEKQLNDLEQVIKIKKNADETLQSAIQSVYSEVTVPIVPRNVSNVSNGNEQLLKLLRALEAKNNSRDQEVKSLSYKIDVQSKTISELVEQNKKLLEHFDSLKAEFKSFRKANINDSKKHKGFWQRFFK